MTKGDDLLAMGPVRHAERIVAAVYRCPARPTYVPETARSYR